MNVNMFPRLGNFFIPPAQNKGLWVGRARKEGKKNKKKTVVPGHNVEKLSFKQQIKYPKHNKKNTRLYKTRTRNAFEVLIMDLIDIKNYSKFNKGYKYINVIIDVYTRYLFLIPQKSKSNDTEVIKKLTAIFEKLKNKVKAVFTDQGKEYKAKVFNELLKKYGIHHVYAPLHTKNLTGMAERVIRAFRDWLLERDIDEGSLNWIDNYHEFTNKWNNRKKYQIKGKNDKFTPVQLAKEAKKEKSNIRDYQNDPIDENPKLNLMIPEVGDFVRLDMDYLHTIKNKNKVHAFTKASSKNNWSKDVWSVIGKKHRTMYEIFNIRNKEIIDNVHFSKLLIIKRCGDSGNLKVRGVKGDDVNTSLCHKNYLVNMPKDPVNEQKRNKFEYEKIKLKEQDQIQRRLNKTGLDIQLDELF